MRAFGVRSSASHELAGGKPLDVIGDHPVQIGRRVRTGHETYALGRGAACNVVTAIQTRVASMFRSKAERKVADAGYDPARLPPGQYLTEKWPVLHAGGVPSYPADLAGWDFAVYGEVDTPAHADVGGAERAPQTRSRRTSTASRAGAGSTRIRRACRGRRSGSASVQRPSASPGDRTRRGGLHRKRARVGSSTWRGRCSSTHADGEPLSPEHGWPLASRRAGQVLLEKRQVAPLRSSCARPTSPASGSATGTTTTQIRGRSSGTRSEDLHPAAHETFEAVAWGSDRLG